MFSTWLMLSVSGSGNQLVERLLTTAGLEMLSLNTYPGRLAPAPGRHPMPNLEPGEKVLVPTSVGEGAFPGENLVTVETKTGPVSGFAKTANIVHRHGDSYLMAEVQDVSEDTLTVRLFGSFFTTTGLAYIPSSAKLLRAG